VTSPNQHPKSHAEGSENDQSKGNDDPIDAGDSSLDAHTDQQLVVRKYNISLGNTSNLSDNSSKDASPMVKTHTYIVAFVGTRVFHKSPIEF